MDSGTRDVLCSRVDLNLSRGFKAYHRNFVLYMHMIRSQYLWGLKWVAEPRDFVGLVPRPFPSRFLDHFLDHFLAISRVIFSYFVSRFRQLCHALRSEALSLLDAFSKTFSRVPAPLNHTKSLPLGVEPLRKWVRAICHAKNGHSKSLALSHSESGLALRHSNIENHSLLCLSHTKNGLVWRH